MTREEWLACTDPLKMLAFIQGRASPRKLRLLACAFCHRVYHLLPEESRVFLDLGERVAEGLVSTLELARLRVRMDSHPRHPVHLAAGAARATVEPFPFDAATRASSWACSAVGDAAVKSGVSKTEEGHGRAEAECQADLVRDVVGNPFSWGRIDPLVARWNNGTVSRMAKGIYEDRRFGDLPLLRDALLGTGCDDEGLLYHLRYPSPHVRGCWVLDLLLGKT